MSDNTSSIKRLLSVTSELEASAIVAALAAHGIKARYDGAYTAGFLAEAPGEIQVLVLEEDFARATDVVKDSDDHPAVIDWSTVDCGDPEPPKS
jgi:type III secretory pathway lipoprotein EscJ